MKCQNFGFLVHGMGKKSSLCLSISSLSFWCLFHSYVLNILWSVTYHTNSMDHNSSWEANSDTASWEISHILCAFEVHDSWQSPLVWPPSQINQVNILPSNFLNTDFSITFPSVPVSSMWSLSICSPYQNCVCSSVLPHMCRVSYPSQHPWFYHLDTNWWTLPIMQLCTLYIRASSTHFLLLSY